MILGVMGVVAAQVFTVFGAAYGTAKSAVGIHSMGVMHPDLVMVLLTASLIASPY